MQKIKEIYQGFKNSIFKVEEIELLAKKRLVFCRSCSFNINNKCSKNKCEIIDNKEICGCNCYINKKVRSPKSKCPKGNW